MVGRDVELADVEKEHDAVLWALGCWTGRGVPLEGWDETPNCVSAVKFLEQFNEGEMKYTGKKVLCIGGGDTSIDVVSVSRRIGTLADLTAKTLKMWLMLLKVHMLTTIHLRMFLVN